MLTFYLRIVLQSTVIYILWHVGLSYDRMRFCIYISRHKSHNQVSQSTCEGVCFRKSNWHCSRSIGCSEPMGKQASVFYSYVESLTTVINIDIKSLSSFKTIWWQFWEAINAFLFALMIVCTQTLLCGGNILCNRIGKTFLQIILNNNLQSYMCLCLIILHSKGSKILIHFWNAGEFWNVYRLACLILFIGVF